MFLLDDILFAPLKAATAIGKAFKKHAEEKFYDIPAIKEALQEVQELRSSNEITEEEFQRKEAQLLDRFAKAREYHQGVTKGEKQGGWKVSEKEVKR